MGPMFKKEGSISSSTLDMTMLFFRQSTTETSVNDDNKAAYEL